MKNLQGMRLEFDRGFAPVYTFISAHPRSLPKAAAANPSCRNTCETRMDAVEGASHPILSLASS